MSGEKVVVMLGGKQRSGSTTQLAVGATVGISGISVASTLSMVTTIDDENHSTSAETSGSWMQS